jgi:purine-binding chemotaxis protein CheW
VSEAPESGPPPGVRCVVFRAGGERFALPLEAVREVVLPQPPFARVPRSGPAVAGAMNLRGRVVPIVDLARLLGLPHASIGGPAQVLVLGADRPSVGLLVGAVAGVEPLAPEAERAPARATCGDGSAACVRGVAAARDGAATVLDADALSERAFAHFGAR